MNSNIRSIIRNLVSFSFCDNTASDSLVLLSRQVLSTPVKKFNFKDKSCIGRNLWRRSTLSVSITRCQVQDCLLSLLHTTDPNIPSLDDLSSSDLKVEFTAPLNRRVKDSSILQFPCIMDYYLISFLWCLCSLTRNENRFHDSSIS